MLDALLFGHAQARGLLRLGLVHLGAGKFRLSACREPQLINCKLPRPERPFVWVYAECTDAVRIAPSPSDKQGSTPE
jgi:hypothetical protein